MNAASNRKPTRDPRFIEGVLANLALMDGVSRSVTRQLSTQSSLIQAKRGDVLIQRGAPVRGLYAIAYGAVKKRLRPAGGREIVLGLLRQGDTFGEVPALLGAPANVEAVALTDTMLVVINAVCIGTQTVTDPRLARNITHLLARRMQALLLEYERSSLSSLQRVAAYLDSLAEPVDGRAWVARLPVSKTLVAARLNIKKETLSRALHELAARGVISVAGRDIAILDRPALSGAAL